jgi:crotonobetainyl-CoA:carnitine CoA-transferase CaiB-like acyl-CoA transferase
MSGILDGVTVLDFTRLLAGPFATQILGDLGADVIKIERPGGEQSRSYGIRNPGELPAVFLAYNRNKQSLVIDMNDPEGRAEGVALAAKADVIVENYRAGVMDSWGLDFASVSAVNPRVVYCSIAGFGREGDFGQRAANDIIIQAYSGLLSITGFPGQPPVRSPAPVADIPAGMYAALAVIAALLNREKSGKGQHIEISMLETLLSIMGHFITDYLVTGREPQPLGSGASMGVPNQAFPTIDGWVVIATVDETMWKNCCEAIGQPTLADDPRFATLEQRYRYTTELSDCITEITSQWYTGDLVAALAAKGVSTAPVLTVPQVVRDHAVVARDTLMDVPFGAQHITVVRSPLRFSATPTVVRHGVPLLDSYRNAGGKGSPHGRASA